MASLSVIAFRSSSDTRSILATSEEVLNPSKKCTKGTRHCSVAEWATKARSCASCTEEEASMANPVWRIDMTSLWSPKMERAWVATVRAATWMTPADNSPAILYMFGIIKRRP